MTKTVAPSRTRRAALLLAATALALLAAWPASAQQGGPIFRRFEAGREVRNNWQALFELPAAIRPQGNPDAPVVENSGLNYVSSFRPENRLYLSRSIGFARAEWEPREADVERVKIRVFDLSFLLNHVVRDTMVISYGLGLGVMDGIVKFNDSRNFSERLEPFFPIQFGLSLRLGRSFQAGLKLSQFAFFRTNPVISATRLLVGFGFNY